MKILLTADFHTSLPWFEWLDVKAAEFDLICIAGDFLDLFSQEPKSKQVSLVQGYLSRVATTTTIAICSGNHDSYGPIVPAARGPTYPWLAELDKIQGIISDGQTRIIGDLIISTLPYCATEQAKRILLDRGRSIRKSRGLKWLVLHHEPPPFLETADHGEHEAKALIEEYLPDVWLSGHEHDLPYKLGASGPTNSRRRSFLRLVKSSKRRVRTISSLIPKAEKSNGEALAKFAIAYPRQSCESPKASAQWYPF